MIFEIRSKDFESFVVDIPAHMCCVSRVGEKCFTPEGNRRLDGIRRELVESGRLGKSKGEYNLGMKIDGVAIICEGWKR